MRCTLRRPRSSKFPCATPAFIAFTNPLRTLVSLSKGQHLIKPPSAPLPVYSWPRCKQFRLRNEYGCNHSQRPVGSGTSADTHGELSEPLSSLTSCSGCGALAQTLQPAEAGYYSLNRASVKQFIESREEFSQIHHERDQHFARALEHADPSILRALAGGEEPEMTKPRTPASPLCDRCHNLLHHHSGAPIIHPSLRSIRDIISQSPHQYNHIYHVLDAADFPLSLIQNIHSFLKLAPLRPSNRRAKHVGYCHGQKAELSFIITRCDLIAPRKEAVDKLVPYFREILRQAIGRSAQEARLGNVLCVSSKRGWRTKELKAQIWQHGGGGWMVGKANVGKSNLFEVVFPKGSDDDVNFERLREEARHLQPAQDGSRLSKQEEKGNEHNRHAYLLPPAREETPYPAMPTVSALPGTTASPIRIPFGRRKGELVDLPGLERSSLNAYVLPEYRRDMIMRTRISPEQKTIKPGQTLVLGGLIRLKPLTDSLVFLAYPFVPLISHITSEPKIEAMQNNEKTLPPHYQVDESTWKGLSSAGTFQLKWDVTRQRAGPLTSKSVADFKPDHLPFKVLSADILIESLGWVELVVQVRRKDYNAIQEGQDASANYPVVEVSSPNGKYIGVRRPMGAWILNKKAKRPVRGSRQHR